MHHHSFPRTLLFFVFAILVGGNTSLMAQTTIFAEGFEGGNALTNRGFWTLDDGFEPNPNKGWWIVNSGFGDQLTHNGTNKAYCAGLGFEGTESDPVYPADYWANMMQTNIDLTGYTSATLTFWYKLKIPVDDYLDTFAIFANKDDLSEWSVFDVADRDGTIDNWTQRVVRLDDYVGGLCNLRFEFISDVSNDACTNPEECNEPFIYPADFEGIYIDDIVVTGENNSYRPDYNQDGITDLVFQHTNGALAVWNIDPNVVGSNALFTTNHGSITTNDIFTSTNIVVSGGVTNRFVTVERRVSTNNQGLVTVNPSSFGTNNLRGAAAIVTSQGKPPTAAWKLVGHSDFDTNGISDLLFQNINGALAVWYMTNAAATTINSIVYQVTNRSSVVRWTNITSSLSTNVTRSSTNLISTTNNVTVQNTAPATLQKLVFLKSASLRPVGLNWQLCTITDLNNDGKRDFIFQHTDGRIAFWYMNGTNLIGSGQIRHGATFLKVDKLVGVIDMNSDGQKDLVTQKSTGSIAVWNLSGIDYVPVSRAIPNHPDSGVTLSKDWRVMQVTDYNDDRQVDFVVQHTDGQIAIWFMGDFLLPGTGKNVTGIIGKQILRNGAKIPTGWRIVGPK